MTLRIVGAGLGRTGTHSLKLALERLLGGPCYHMIEVFGHPDHIAQWQLAAEGGTPDWESLFAEFTATVDWPGGSFYQELAATFPDAIVLLSTRPADEWWRSANATIFEVSRRGTAPNPVFQAQLTMIRTLLENRFTPDWSEEGPAKAAFERHNAAVRSSVPPERLVEWHPGDGWEPLCRALEVAVPDEPFPHVNTSEEFRSMVGLDQT